MEYVKLRQSKGKDGDVDVWGEEKEISKWEMELLSQRYVSIPLPWHLKGMLLLLPFVYVVKDTISFHFYISSFVLIIISISVLLT